VIAAIDARAAKLGQDRTKYILTLVERDLKEETPPRRHKFASHDLIGAFSTGIKSGDNVTIRKIARRRMNEKIADTGLLKALVDTDDLAHEWGIAQFQEHAPFHTCDAVLVELAFVLGSPIPGLQMVQRGDLILEFNLADEIQPVLDLLHKYRDRKMDLADACLVRMTELESQCKVWTVDQADFQVYRRHGRHAVPCEFPPGK
jgi:predicted nucleic acid-binding protein